MTDLVKDTLHLPPRFPFPGNIDFCAPRKKMIVMNQPLACKKSHMNYPSYIFSASVFYPSLFACQNKSDEITTAEKSEVKLVVTWSCPVFPGRFLSCPGRFLSCPGRFLSCPGHFKSFLVVSCRVLDASRRFLSFLVMSQLLLVVFGHFLGVSGRFLLVHVI